MIRRVQSLLNDLLRSKYCFNTCLMRSSQCRRLIPLRCLFIHHHNSCNILAREVPLVSRLPPYFVVRNNWSKYFLIQRSPSCCAYCYGVVRRHYNAERTHQSGRNRSTLVYTTAVAIIVLGLSYAAVPLYRMFCQATGYGGTVLIDTNLDKIEDMKPIQEREITIKFNADTSPRLRWKFKPQQNEIKVVPGETALAFYSATNLTDRPITGISTYNVIPFSAGQYFHKVQCFCFEEQRLNPHEQVDMPVFFYIDPDFDDDPAVFQVNEITLSYTFFESTQADEEFNPVPPYSNNIDNQPQHSM